MIETFSVTCDALESGRCDAANKKCTLRDGSILVDEWIALLEYFAIEFDSPSDIEYVYDHCSYTDLEVKISITCENQCVSIW